MLASSLVSTAYQSTAHTRNQKEEPEGTTVANIGAHSSVNAHRVTVSNKEGGDRRSGGEPSGRHTSDLEVRQLDLKRWCTCIWQLFCADCTNGRCC